MHIAKSLLPLSICSLLTLLACGSSEPTEDPTELEDGEGLEPKDPNAQPAGKLDGVGSE